MKIRLVLASIIMAATLAACSSPSVLNLEDLGAQPTLEELNSVAGKSSKVRQRALSASSRGFAAGVMSCVGLGSRLRRKTVPDLQGRPSSRVMYWARQEIQAWSQRAPW
jgi:hypothetical protein